jgi:hypothetical protein
MEQRALKRLLLAAVVSGLAGAGTWLAIARDLTPSQRSAPSRVDRIVPEGTRIRVEVLNGTNVRGLARRASLYLRDLGFDVVRFDQDSTTVRDSTLVVDHTGHPEWARMIGDVLGPARLETEPDSSRYVDITVRLGSRWRPPAKTLYP